MTAITLMSCLLLAAADPVPPTTVVAEGDAPPPTAVQVLTEEPGVRSRFEVSGEVAVGSLGVYGTIAPPAGPAFTRGLFPIPSARLDGAVGGRVAATYLFAERPGELTVVWQGFGASGEAILLGYDPQAALYLSLMRELRNTKHPELADLVMRPTAAGNALVRSRASGNLVDLTYGAPVFVNPSLATSVYGGGRIGTFFSEDRAVGAGYAQSATNRYVGAGPMGGARVEYLRESAGRLAWQTVYGGLEAGVLFGHAEQRFREAVAVPLPGPAFRGWDDSADRAVPFVSAELGTGSGPARVFRWDVGVRYSQFFGVGDVGRSSLDFQLFTVFVRLGARF